MSTVKLKKMRWGNMFSYADNNEVDLSKSRVTQIVGVNGAGKSSIPVILEEATYNKNSAGFKKTDIPNRNLSKPYWMELPFSVDGDEYLLHINKGSSLKATMTKNGEDISQHTGSKTIQMFEQIVGIDFKTFTQLVYQNTDSSLEFLKATDSKRKEFLVGLFDLAEYGEKKAKYDEALKSINKDISALEGGVRSTLNSLKRLESQLEIEIASEVPEPESPDDLVSEKAKLESSLASIEETNSRKVKANSVLTQLAKLRAEEEIQADIDSVETPEGDKSDLTEKLGRHNSNTAAAKALISKIAGLEGQCPTCLQEVDEDFINKLIKENEEIIEENRAKANEIVQTISNIDSAVKKIKALEKELSHRKSIESRKESETYQDLEDYEELENSIKELSASITSVRNQIQKARSHNQKVAADIAKRQGAEDQIDNLQEDLERYNEQLDSLNKKVGPLETLRKAFGPSGLVAYKLENRVKDLETETNKYLAKLSDGKFNIAFKLEKEKLNVIIYDEDSAVSINCLSAGERARVVIGTLLGIRKIMQSIAKTTLNVLFLDEVISVMDDMGKEQLVEVLLDEENLNTFLVSHSWSHPLIEKLEVVKDESGISRIS